MNRSCLEQLARDWRRRLVIRDLLVALAAANGCLVLALWQPILFRCQLPIIALAGTLILRLTASRPWTLDSWRLSRHLDRTCPVLEESTALFLRPSGQLTLLEHLQIQRVNQALSNRTGPPHIPGAPPHDFLRGASLSLAASALLAASSGLLLAQRSGPLLSHPALSLSSPNNSRNSSHSSAPLLPHIVGNNFTVTPPAYTGHAPRRVDGFTVEVEEGATVAWEITLDRPARDCRLISGSSLLPLTINPAQHLQGSCTAEEPALFSLAAILPDGTVWNPPELFSIKIIKDRPPVVRLLEPVQTRTEIDPSASNAVRVEATISDDYAVADARLVVTVAKGSGEAVKFREQTIPFDTNTPGGTNLPPIHRCTKSLDLATIGLEPGDELYFFVEAHDNRQPTPNSTRSETRFLTLRGADAKKTTTGRGVAGVNLIPAYFRSERQLIIDTEKLIADLPTLPDAEVRTRSNDLGADQGFLRLRYGRFLGEDQEQSALTDHLETNTDPLQAGGPTLSAGPHAAASIALRFKQEHIEQDREGGDGDNLPLRPPPGGSPLTADQIRQPFVDSHDSGEKPTFFDGETKGNMRDALDAMWTAESFLRTVRPQEALAPEHRALEILKDLQQSARAYVQHVGFDAPPLKVASRRLQGDAADVPPRTEVSRSLPSTDPAFISIRTALLDGSVPGQLSADALATIEGALTAAATRQPDDFLPGLQAVRRFRAGGYDPTIDQLVLQRALLRLLPPAYAVPERSTEPAPALSVSYFQNLQSRGATHP